MSWKNLTIGKKIGVGFWSGTGPVSGGRSHELLRREPHCD